MMKIYDYCKTSETVYAVLRNKETEYEAVKRIERLLEQFGNAYVSKEQYDQMQELSYMDFKIKKYYGNGIIIIRG